MGCYACPLGTITIVLKHKKLIALGILFLPFAFFIYYTIQLKYTKFNLKELPVLSQSSIPDFSFVTHTGDTIRRADMEGKIVVADFFFTTCPGICPKMSRNMETVQDVLLNHDKLKSDYLIISHTVDPEHDTVAVLKAYAEEHEVNPDMWKLVTGSKQDIYTLAIDFYKLATREADQAAAAAFVHSEKFVLLDKAGFIRGYYDGTDQEKVKLLLSDIVNLDVSYRVGETKN